MDTHKGSKTIERKPAKTDDDLEIPFKMNGENHTLYFRNGKLFMASKFGELIDKLDETIKALGNSGLESIDVNNLLIVAERVIKRGKSKERKKLTKQSRILEAAQQLIKELQDLDVQDEELKGDIGTLDDLSKDAVNEVAEKHQTALDQKVASFVSSTVFKSDNNKLGRSLIIDGLGNLDWAKTGSSTNYALISRAVAIKIKNEHGSKGDNYQSRGPVRKRDGSIQINLEMKPNDVEWSDYNDPHFTRVGYCNYHINVKT